MDLSQALQRYWGYDTFRPLQQAAMQAVMEGRDSVVVLPTGGGKSLCFQAPASISEGVAVVVSPLISLMKDQVDSLTECGIVAGCVNSSMSAEERRKVSDQVRSGELKLLYISPERLVLDRTLDFLANCNLSFIAIDEAHCISDWGHDFRPEYRGLKILKQAFPGLPVHAYTATATEQVRDDIVRNLKLENPTVLVGGFDRPNLTYRVQPRKNLLDQVRQVIDRHRDDAGVIYCIRRTDVDDLATKLTEAGYKVRPYHAGLTDIQRQRNQEAFIREKVDIIVATVAFGMGIDKSNVRYVIHAGAPKSLEGYQQESGRAGRDGLEAECCLFFSGTDFQIWRNLQDDLSEQARRISLEKVEAIEAYCQTPRCRHSMLVSYFGDSLEAENCQACDICLNEVELVPDALIVGQKILSCVVRLKQGFGAEYTSQVLHGSREQKILDRRHNELSTWGILKEHDSRVIRNWLEQLVGQGYLRKSGEYSVVEVTPAGRQLLKGEEVPKLFQPAAAWKKKESKARKEERVGVHQGLFEELRRLRRELAEERGVPPFLIFNDATLREMAAHRPGSLQTFREISGVGDKKCKEFGPTFLAGIADYCSGHQLALDLKVEGSE